MPPMPYGLKEKDRGNSFKTLALSGEALVVKSKAARAPDDAEN
jgi:hypothetical protein